MGTFSRRELLKTGAAMALVAAATTGARPAAAVPRRGPGPADWEQVGLDTRVRRLFTPASGALFALFDDELRRSDDAGDTWRSVALPVNRTTGRRFAYVHPLDHRTIYATGDAGLYRTDDDAAQWSLILPGPRRVVAVAASPADPALVYAALTETPVDFWLERSRDGGVTWDSLDEQHNTLCGWGVPVLEAHPAQPRRVIRTAGCYAGRDTSDDLEQSLDAGETWTAVVRPQTAFPSEVVVGAGAGSSRWYLAANRDARAGGSTVFTSADDGGSWREVLQFRGGGTIEPGRTNVRVGGIAADGALPERVYVALNSSTGPEWDKTLLGSGVQASADAGATWVPRGRQDLPEVTHLALGIDGAWLFAATSSGVWRLRIT